MKDVSVFVQAVTIATPAPLKILPYVSPFGKTPVHNGAAALDYPSLLIAPHLLTMTVIRFLNAPKITIYRYLIFSVSFFFLNGTCYLRKILLKRNLYLLKYNFMIALTHVTVNLDLEFTVSILILHLPERIFIVQSDSLFATTSVSPLHSNSVFRVSTVMISFSTSPTLHSRSADRILRWSAPLAADSVTDVLISSCFFSFRHSAKLLSDFFERNT